MECLRNMRESPSRDTGRGRSDLLGQEGSMCHPKRTPTGGVVLIHCTRNGDLSLYFNLPSSSLRHSESFPFLYFRPLQSLPKDLHRPGISSPPKPLRPPPSLTVSRAHQPLSHLFLVRPPRSGPVPYSTDSRRPPTPSLGTLQGRDLGTSPISWSSTPTLVTED